MSDTLGLLRAALSDPGLVQSFSGVRTLFGLGPGVSKELSVLATAYAWCYAREVLGEGEAVLLIGRDPRPTGENVSRALARGFLAGAAACGTELRIVDLGIITTPLAQTAVRALNAAGGVVVTASHNPLEHNGFKFLTGATPRVGTSPAEIRTESKSGRAPAGALLSAPQMGAIIARVRKLAEGQEADLFERTVGAIDPHALDLALNGHDHDSPRVKAERAYLDDIGRDWGIVPHCLKPLTLGPALLDPNGGAGSGVDARVLEHFGVRTIEINAELGFPEHGIDTDGTDPASGRHMLLRVARAAARHGARFGVAFDYDADRGNLVLPGSDESAIIPPQRVASFNLAFALARRRLIGRQEGPLAVVLSDATSLASVRVAEAFGARVFLVETGEINVVTKMSRLREEGYDVPVGVEGANGGTVFGTSTCRDGLQVALAAALAESQVEVAEEWLRVASAAQLSAATSDQGRGLADLIRSVPANSNVMYRLSAPPVSHGELKRRVEAEFMRTVWPQLSGRFENYEFENFEGTERVTERTGEETGGWRVLLTGPSRRAFVFLRGSRTEAGVWRMIVDCDDPDDFAILEPLARNLFAACSS
ncbi:MAG: hypothetical protein ACP5R5_00625 [Armatimonadota bacterium]